MRAKKIDPVPTISQTSDGRWFLTWIAARQNQDEIVDFFARHGFTEGVREALPGRRRMRGQWWAGATFPAPARPMNAPVALDAIIRDFTRSFTAEDMPWREAQDVGLLWSPCVSHMRPPTTRTGWSARPWRRWTIPNWAAASAMSPANG